MNIPLIEARWEEDGFHEDAEGRRIKHYKGDYKLNANGMPYYETLGAVSYTHLQYFINNNGTTRMIGKARAAGSPIAEGSNEKVGWGRLSPVSYTHLIWTEPHTMTDITT